MLWLIFTQIVASGLGGYLAGRLRVRWPDVHLDEVHFRDTAHGLLTWAIASLAAALLATALASAVVGGTVAVGAAAVQGGMQAGVQAGVMGGMMRGGERAADTGNRGGTDLGAAMNYWADSLLRGDASTPSSSSAASTAGSAQAVPGVTEVSRILLHAQESRTLSAEDVRYLGQIVAQRTGLAQQAAEQRVTEIYAQIEQRRQQLEAAAKRAADEARKGIAYASLWMFVALLIGAFVASWLATIGGRQRDR